jgi:hypothetical protein
MRRDKSDICRSLRPLILGRPSLQCSRCNFSYLPFAHPFSCLPEKIVAQGVTSSRRTVWRDIFARLLNPAKKTGQMRLALDKINIKGSRL